MAAPVQTVYGTAGIEMSATPAGVELCLSTAINMQLPKLSNLLVSQPPYLPHELSPLAAAASGGNLNLLCALHAEALD